MKEKEAITKAINEFNRVLVAYFAEEHIPKEQWNRVVNQALVDCCKSNAIPRPKGLL